MKIACCTRHDKVFQYVQNALIPTHIECEHFASEASLLRTLRRRSFDLIVVDSDNQMPNDAPVFSWLNCRTDESTPVVLLSSTHREGQLAFALDAGADDFVVNAFDSAELVARLQAVLRRYRPKTARRSVEIAGFVLDRESRRLSDNGVPVALTSREFTMAWLLFSSPGMYFSRDAISVSIWGVDSDVASRTIEQHVYKLRKKLQLNEERGVIIRTAYTHGYRLEICAQPIGVKTLTTSTSSGLPPVNAAEFAIG
jgi:DNA-binding response OmpR family regulator